MSQKHLNVDSLPGPDTIARRTFPNGVVGLAYENFSSPSVVVHGWLWVGSIDVPREKAGLSGLTASLLTRGTANRTFAQISEEIESVGATLSAGSAGHTTRFTIKSLVEDLPLLMDILTDCLYHPVFPDEYVERRRGEIMTALEQREQNTQAMASLRFSETMYPNHPYGNSQLGYTDTVKALTRQDVERFYRQHYGAQGMTVTIVGAVPCREGLDILQQAFGSWQGADHTQAPLPPMQPLLEPLKAHTEIPGKSQSDIVLGWPGLSRRDPDFHKAYLANCVLGQFGMMGRIGQHVREEQGLAYYAYTSLDAGIGPGPWIAVAGVAPENVEPAVEAMMAQALRMRTELVEEQELADNKAYIVDSLPLRLEGNEGIAAQIVTMELFELGLDYLRRFPGIIESITAEDIRAIAERVMVPEAYVLSVAGPAS